MITAISNNNLQSKTNFKQKTPVLKTSNVIKSAEGNSAQTKESLLSVLLKPLKKLLTPKETPLEWSGHITKSEKPVPDNQSFPLEW